MKLFIRKDPSFKIDLKDFAWEIVLALEFDKF